MLPALLVIAFVVAGTLIFSLVAGIVIFKQMFIRKYDDGSLSPEVIRDSLEKLKHSAAGTELDGIKMENAGQLAAHLNDTRIMIPLLEAKLRWFAHLERDDSDIERVFIQGNRNKKLAGYYVASTRSVCSTKFNNAEPDTTSRQDEYTALIVHGYTDSAAGMAYLAEEYLQQGINVLAVDCRAHGYSQGKAITLGYTDAKDVARWVEYLCIQKMQSNGDKAHKTKIILHGVSMGAAAVMQSLATKKMQSFASDIAIAVADCGFSSAKEQLSIQAQSLLGNSIFQRGIARLVLAGMSMVNLIVNGFTMRRNSPQRALRKRKNLATARIPLVLFHGEKDAFVPTEMATTLAEAAQGTQVVIRNIKDAPHIGSYFYAPETYMGAILETLKNHLV